MGYVGFGTRAASPFSTRAMARWDIPSFAPMVTIASVSGSSSTAARRLTELVHDVLGGGLVRVAHPEVNDVLPPGPGLDLEVVHDAEDVRRQPLDPCEFRHGVLPPGDPAPPAPKNP